MPATPLTTPGSSQDPLGGPAEGGQGSGLEATQTRRQTDRAALNHAEEARGQGPGLRTAWRWAPSGTPDPL